LRCTHGSRPLWQQAYPDWLSHQLSKSIRQLPAVLNIETFGLFFDRLAQFVHGICGIHVRVMDYSSDAINNARDLRSDTPIAVGAVH
jgi:hypothetical protein